MDGYFSGKFPSCAERKWKRREAAEEKSPSLKANWTRKWLPLGGSGRERWRLMREDEVSHREAFLAAPPSERTGGGRCVGG